jgi:hypothetical protein
MMPGRFASDEALRPGMRHARSFSSEDALMQAAERTVAGIESQIARAESDYLAGTLDAERWQRLDTRLGGELAAAQAERERFAQRIGEIEAMADMRDIEADTLRHLAHLREVIAGEIRDAATLDALRVALMRLFDHFTVHAFTVEGVAPEPRYWQPELLARGGFYIEPHPAITSGVPAADL